MTRQEKLNRLSAETKQYLRNHFNKIAECNTKQLLEYSQELHKKRNKFAKFTLDVLFEAVDMRRNHLNSNSDEVAENNEKRAIREFMKKNKSMV